MHINSNPRTHSVAWLTEQRKKGKLNTDISIQRNAVWSHLHQSNLIMTILYNGPISNLWLERDAKGIYKVIDGKQRTLTLQSFAEDKFALSKKMRYSTVETIDDTTGEKVVVDVAGKKFSELGYDLTNRILEYQLSFTIIEKMSPEERAFVFFMGNQSVPLGNVHFLPVVLGEYIMEKINDVCNHPFIAEKVKLTTPALRKRDDLKIIIQYLILKSGRDLGFSGKEIIEFCDLIHSGEEPAVYEDIIKVLDYLDAAIPEKRAHLRTVHVPVIMYVAQKAMEQGMEAEMFGAKLDEFFMSENEEYKAASLQGSAKKANVLIRVSLMSNILN